MEALQLIEKDVAVAIGPQSSGIACVISDVANELHVPLLSLATDPTLYYRWNKVIAIYVDDNYGRNGVSALGDALALKCTKISHKVAFSPGASTNDISNLSGEVNLMESRVIVVYVNPDSGLTIFSVANSFSMCVGHDGRGRISFGDKGSSDQDETPVNVKHLNPTYNINMTQLSVGTNVTDANFTAIMDFVPSFTVLSGAAYIALTESFDAQVKEKRHVAGSQFAFEYCYDLSSCEARMNACIAWLLNSKKLRVYCGDACR
ncbi:hypothetical protein Nepgr_009882 [Nepenthes gracilis]|uniref:Receptor ligand binding region domain-containing protein n=1 Tax=Nepenthes gracilis TaxID=150966 RepID=A0AAD3SC64_NEPGR|nr:hypothetical protein Nepgr_009882 [Nepenthes gracilis]